MRSHVRREPAVEADHDHAAPVPCAPACRHSGLDLVELVERQAERLLDEYVFARLERLQTNARECRGASRRRPRRSPTSRTSASASVVVVRETELARRMHAADAAARRHAVQACAPAALNAGISTAGIVARADETDARVRRATDAADSTARRRQTARALAAARPPPDTRSRMPSDGSHAANELVGRAGLRRSQSDARSAAARRAAIGHHVEHRLEVALLGPAHEADGIVVALAPRSPGRSGRGRTSRTPGRSAPSRRSRRGTTPAR